jgi:two-component system sensor histidine kinase/response regulator
MNWTLLRKHSLKTRITLFTLLIFVLSIWSLAFHSSLMLRQDMLRLLGEQQLSIVSLMAADINRQLDERLRALEKVIEGISPEVLGDTAAIQTLIDDRPILQTLFNAGIIAHRRDGTAIADSLPDSGRIGVDYMDVDSVAMALREGRSNISRPVIGKKLGTPVIGITAPIRDPQGVIIGALSGIIDLGRDNFLDKIPQGRYGKTGGYLLVAPQYRLVVTASDKTRIMETLPAPGINATLDRFIDGFEGPVVFTNPLGVDILASAKPIPVSGWYIAVTLPTAEAFAPINDIEQRLLAATLLLTLLAGGLTWWMLKRQFAPLLSATQALAAQAQSSLPPQPLPVSGQDEIGRLIGSFNRLLQTLAEREEALLSSEERFRTLAKRAPVGIFLADANGDYLYVNPRWCEMAAMDGPDALGAGWLDGLHADDRSAVLASWRQSVERGENWSREYRFQSSDGQVCWVDSQASPQRDDAGRIIGQVGINLDITERKAAESEFRRLNASLEERVGQRTAELETANAQLTEAKRQSDSANIAKSAFLANMSHEIRTPMNGIIGMADILRREGVSPKQEQRLAVINTSARHLLSVINDILDISKIEAGKFALEEAPLHIGSLLANVGSIVAERARAGEIELLIETGDWPRNLLGDPTRLQQALLNYAANAVKFTENGRVTLRALVQNETADTALLRFEVTDSGIGIDAETLSRLFCAFEQADSSLTRKYGGTGLGLAITRRLAELMGGSAGARSTPGVGSTFWFTARTRKGAEAFESVRPDDDDCEILVSRGYFGQRLLVVDDEPINREVARMQLEAAGLCVDEAADGAQAVALTRKTAYAAIFMDMQMPRVNGLEATRQIRQLQQIQQLDSGRQIPIIAMTANVFADDMAQCLAAGMDEILTKPFTPGELFATLLRALRRADGEAANVTTSVSKAAPRP